MLRRYLAIKATTRLRGQAAQRDAHRKSLPIYSTSSLLLQTDQTLLLHEENRSTTLEYWLRFLPARDCIDYAVSGRTDLTTRNTKMRPNWWWQRSRRIRLNKHVSICERYRRPQLTTATIYALHTNPLPAASRRDRPP